MRRYLSLILGLLILTVTSTTGLTAQDADGTLSIRADEVIAEVSPYVLGANYGPLSAIPVDLIEAAQNSGITFLRYPGGRWGDLNDIQPFQIDMYIRIARLIGAEPSIHVRLENGTPEAAAELVRYANIEKGYNIQYWYIGNEPNLFDDYTTEDLNAQWRAIAEAMLEVDSDITLIGPDISQWNGTPEVNPRDPEGRDWLREFLRENGDLVDVVSVHRYPFPRSMANPEVTIEDLRANLAEWDNIIPNLRQVVLEETGRDLPVAVTEANSHWSKAIGGEATPDSHYNAIWWADALGRMLRHEPFIVAYFDLQSSDGRGTWGLMATYNVRPTYYVYQFYQRFGQQMVEAQSDLEDISVYAAQRNDGALTVIAINLSDEARTVNFNIEGVSINALEERWLFDLEHPEAILVDAEDILNGEATLLPPQSISMFVLGLE